MPNKPAETAEVVTVDQAFKAAMEEHSQPEQTSEAAAPVKTETSGETKAEEKTQAEQKPEKAAVAQTETATEQLLTDEEFSKLGTDIQAIRKGMNKAFTQKTQALAAERKAVAGYKDFIDLYERDPKEAIRQVAEHHNLDVRDKGEVAKPAATAEKVADETNAILREALGADLEGLADALTPAIQKLVAQQVAPLVDQRVKPLEDKERARALETAQTQMQADLDGLTSRHSDWREYKVKMDELSNQFIPGPGCKSAADWLDHLYDLASRDAKAAKAAKTVVDKINKVPENAEAAGSGVATHTVSSQPTVIDLDTAIRMALKGETVGS